MARNVQFQILRGVFANMPALALGEMYFTTDTNLLYFGTPGVGLGYIQIGDATQVNERLDRLIVLMEAIRRALVLLATQDGYAKEADFDPEIIAVELAAGR